MWSNLACCMQSTEARNKSISNPQVSNFRETRYKQKRRYSIISNIEQNIDTLTIELKFRRFTASAKVSINYTFI